MRETLERDNLLRPAESLPVVGVRVPGDIWAREAALPFVAESPAMRDVVRVLISLARRPFAPVVFAGPPGSGKRRAARLLHELTFGTRAGQAPFIDVDCNMFGAERMESELFGCERCASPSARPPRRLLVEKAVGGTLVLEGTEAIPRGLEKSLSKLLESGRLFRLGAKAAIEARLCLIATTEVALPEPRELNSVLSALDRRLARFSIAIPRLSARTEDIAPLARSFLVRTSARGKADVRGISVRALERLERYPFPGNVRELRSILQRAVLEAKSHVIRTRDLALE